ncbi:hypothetical protein [Paenirhodobacter populi]|uniref:Lipoprotein n=1 Tax=Paenirhodobacter populi TaxID=2306993 RepID=A0A443IQM2_9RHOB|nr:hypothetical protein [Sinirhodobacter populi]RWR07952.1 hypothetical protein D2T32_10080 [Sinirhodobacter populi]RWR08861.1 hypothetical protein D2T33_14980 [Sinirhodobacter populi]RWR23690.1 hypothetical protein D2T30_04395 [Sinirhodobacter populi]
MKRVIPVLAVSALMLGGCAMEMPGVTAGEAGAQHPLAPPVPQNVRAHALWQKQTGINGDSIAAIGGDTSQAYIYYDPIVANQAALAAAPAKLCASYGKQLASSYTTLPQDGEPGVKVIAVTCH